MFASSEDVGSYFNFSLDINVKPDNWYKVPAFYVSAIVALFSAASFFYSLGTRTPDLTLDPSVPSPGESCDAGLGILRYGAAAQTVQFMYRIYTSIKFRQDANAKLTNNNRRAEYVALFFAIILFGMSGGSECYYWNAYDLYPVIIQLLLCVSNIFCANKQNYDSHKSNGIRGTHGSMLGETETVYYSACMASTH